MDYRYPHQIIDTMDSLGYRGRYDHVVLAGGSLGLTHCVERRKTFFDEVDLAIRKHGIGGVLILDHRDCGASKEYLGQTAATSRDAERALHLAQMQAAVGLIQDCFPELPPQAIGGLLLPDESIDELVPFRVSPVMNATLAWS